MKINKLHGFDLTFAEAKEIQNRLAEQLVIEGGPEIADICTVAGCDCAFDRRRNVAFGALVVLEFPSMAKREIITGYREIRFPYVPGYLSFRELEVLLCLFEKLETPPDLVLADGQGIAHPRRIGLASHLGLFLGIPTIGCAKSRLIGTFTEPGIEKGSWTPLLDKDEIIGSLLRTRRGVRPMFISPGHLVGIEKSRELSLACTSKFRLPDPPRITDIEVAKFKKEVLDA